MVVVLKQHLKYKISCWICLKKKIVGGVMKVAHKILTNTRGRLWLVCVIMQTLVEASYYE